MYVWYVCLRWESLFTQPQICVLESQLFDGTQFVTNNDMAQLNRTSFIISKLTLVLYKVEKWLCNKSATLSTLGLTQYWQLCICKHWLAYWCILTVFSTKPLAQHTDYIQYYTCMSYTIKLLSIIKTSINMKLFDKTIVQITVNRHTAYIWWIFVIITT